MSYTTLNRFGEPKHQYSPDCKGKGQFISGAWWPDFGPCSHDYSEQYKMHPTNTIFKEQFAIPKERGDLMAQPMKQVAKEQQFRHDPSREALYKSTIIQPYKKGGRSSPNREWANYQGASIKPPPALEREHTAFRTHMSKSMSSPSLGAMTLPTSLVRLKDGSGRSPSGLAMGSLGGASMPEWVAGNTVASRPPDAAGHAGTTRNAHCRTTAQTGMAHGTLVAGSGTILAAARTQKVTRLHQWEALLNPHA